MSVGSVPFQVFGTDAQDRRDFAMVDCCAWGLAFCLNPGLMVFRHKGLVVCCLLCAFP